jgi:hypothetical protein
VLCDLQNFNEAMVVSAREEASKLELKSWKKVEMRLMQW